MKKVISILIVIAVLLCPNALAFASSDGDTLAFETVITDTCYDTLEENGVSFGTLAYTRAIFANAILIDAFIEIDGVTLEYLDSIADAYIGHSVADDTDVYALGIVVNDKLLMITYFVDGKTKTGFYSWADANPIFGRLAMKDTFDEFFDECWELDEESIEEASKVFEDSIKMTVTAKGK